MQLIYNENVELIYDPDSFELLQTWKGFVPSGLFREVIDTSLYFIRSNKVDLLISDTSRQKVISGNDAEYAASVLDAMFTAGLFAMAFVLPQDVFTRFSLKKFADAGIDADRVGYFNKIEDARKWGGFVKSAKG